jgi:heme-degrading monooxygenase HmoA
MAFARLALFPEGTQQQHEAIVEGLGDAHNNAPGRLLFAAGPTDEGWQIIQIWQTREQLEQWVQDNLGKAFAHAGSRGYKYPPRVTDFEVPEVQM